MKPILMYFLVRAGGRCCNGNVICVGRVLFAAAAALQEAVLCCAQHRHAQSCRATGHISLMLCVSITLERFGIMWGELHCWDCAISQNFLAKYDHHDVNGACIRVSCVLLFHCNIDKLSIAVVPYFLCAPVHVY